MQMAQNTFITNQGKLLSEIINGILPKTSAVDILVGYFYFSGYQLLSQGLKDKHIRILVGLDVDIQITKSIREIDTFNSKRQSRGKMRDDYYEQFINLFNNSDFLDSAVKLESFKLFYDKIKNGTLEIRKTENPCHAKMYIFDYNAENSEGGEDPGNVITGSSNLSYAGLEGRIEINSRFKDKQTHIDAKKIFNELWDTSVIVVDKDNVPEFEEKVIKHIWYEKLYSPYLMYLRVLDEYFAIPSKEHIITPYDITDGRYVNLKYQTDAVQLALQSIENHNGVIIADVVGLGKSIIASTIARNLGLKCIVICPPHLKQQWEVYKDEFSLQASVFTSGKIESALDHFKEVAHRGEKFLIIIDEAHRYRNEYIKDYALLHNLCSANKVVLLTATPFNNRPSDIYSMLKLFQIPGKSSLKTVQNLGATFQNLISTYKKLTEAQREGSITKEEINAEAERISGQIRSIISPLVVRRSRIDLQQIPSYRDDLEIQHIKPVIPDDPIELKYDLSKHKNLYLNTLDLINSKEDVDDGVYRFKSARYAPALYVKPDMADELAKYLEDKTGVQYHMLIGRQRNVSDFMRKLLVQRFESSVAAFKASLSSMIRSSESVLDWIKKGNEVPVFKKGNLPDIEDFYEISEDGLQPIIDAFDLYEQKGLFTIPMRFIKDEFVEDIKSDIALLRKIQEQWFGKSNQILFDPKLEAFRITLGNLRKKDKRRKIIVFSAYADTVDYLGEALQADGNPLRVMKYTSKDASSGSKNMIRANFDAGLRTEMQKDDYDVLIATDAISEGYNLHRAGAIFNYDIPYNPTRVIQRIGRINRINKKVFEHLYIYNYFPTEVGEAETRTREISTLKMAMIHAIMGEDTKALTKDEEVQSFFVERYRQELANSEVASWDSKYRSLLEQMKGTEAYQSALRIPHRARIARKVDKPRQGVLMFGKKGNDYVFKINNEEGITLLSAEEAIALFEAETTESPFEVTKQFDERYQNLKVHLFMEDTEDKYNDAVGEAINKIKLIKKNKSLPADYISDLLSALRFDALTGFEIRFINQLKAKDYKTLPNVISHAYIVRQLETEAQIEEGEESLILTEEIITSK
jgi:superfamily II DNA or RNA helicase